MEQMISANSEAMNAWQVSGGALHAGSSDMSKGDDCGLQSAMLTRSVQTCYSIDANEAGLSSAAVTNYGTSCPLRS